MKFLRRLAGRDEPETGRREDAGEEMAADAESLEAEEAEATAALLRAEQDRLDELRLRQLRYARYAWRPPAQGGERRADDGREGGPEED